MTTSIPYASKLRAPDSMLFRQLEDEAVLLNLDSETYFGLDDVGTRMWTLLTESPTIQAAYDALLAEYKIAPERLHLDLETLIGQLLEHGLLELHDG